MPSWAELAAKDGLKRDGDMYKPVAANDPLRIKMMTCEKANPVEAIVKSGRAFRGPAGELPVSNRLPIYEPLVCASFAAKNLSGDYRVGGGNDDQAGRDPWSICDYLRDSLMWPASFIFIDAEQTGMYDLDMYHYGNPELQKKYVYEGVAGSEGARNWKHVFEWAQTKAKVMLYFVSKEFLASDNCLNEVRDFTEMVWRTKASAAVLFALLDPGLKAEATRRMRELATKASDGGMADREVRAKFSTDNVFDLSDYMIWDDARRRGEGGHKLDLREAAKGMVELRVKIFTLSGGMGDRDAYERDIQQGLACDNVAHDGYKKSKSGGYVRNRYKEDVRRIDINSVDEKTLKERVPHIGDKRADEIVRLRKRLGRISRLEDLEQIDGLKIGAELEKLKMDELKALAEKRGIVPDGDKRAKETWIKALL